MSIKLKLHQLADQQAISQNSVLLVEYLATRFY